MKKVLVIVAHPDDETIWMGGNLIRNSIPKKWDTTIISLCRKDDKDRAPKFFKVCKILNAKGYISDLDDEESGELKNIKMNDIESRIRAFTDGKKYDYIFTHGKNGEYGHKRHKEVSKAVRLMVENKILKCKKLFMFSYTKIREDCYADQNADKFINLNPIELENKKRLIMSIYGFQKNCFEERNCRENEAFTIIK